MATLSGNGTPEVRIRPATRADLLAIHRIERSTFEQPWPYSAFERFLGEDGFLAATMNGAVVGYVVADLLSNYDRDIGHIKDLAVHPDAQGRGIGRTLLRRALLELLVAGASATKLEVRRDNDPAKSLYYSEGFRPKRRVPGYYDDGADAILMVVDMNQWAHAD